MNLDPSSPPPWPLRMRSVFIGFLVIAGVLLAYEHRLHLLGVLPYLLLLACPLMHLFMHHGHGHSAHGDVSHSANAKEARDA